MVFHRVHKLEMSPLPPAKLIFEPISIHLHDLAVQEIRAGKPFGLAPLAFGVQHLVSLAHTCAEERCSCASVVEACAAPAVAVPCSCGEVQTREEVLAELAHVAAACPEESQAAASVLYQHEVALAEDGSGGQVPGIAGSVQVELNYVAQRSQVVCAGSAADHLAGQRNAQIEREEGVCALRVLHVVVDRRR